MEGIMALKKSKELRGGVVAEYWRVESLAMDFNERTVAVRVALYKDEVTRRAEKGWLDSFNVVLPQHLALQVETDLRTKNPVEAMYGYLKQMEQFNGAADV
jgi:hypothetical protein